jgi:hypothetical protein
LSRARSGCDARRTGPGRREPAAARFLTGAGAPLSRTPSPGPREPSTLAPTSGEFAGITLPQVAHTWTFTTGAYNPSGSWDEGGPGDESKSGLKRPRVVHRAVAVSWAGGRMIIKGRRFEPGRIVIRRRDPRSPNRNRRGKVLARAKAGRKGTFTAPFRWPRRHLAISVGETGTWTSATYRRPSASPDTGTNRKAGPGPAFALSIRAAATAIRSRNSRAARDGGATSGIEAATGKVAEAERTGRVRVPLRHFGLGLSEVASRCCSRSCRAREGT